MSSTLESFITDVFKHIILTGNVRGVDPVTLRPLPDSWTEPNPQFGDQVTILKHVVYEQKYTLESEDYLDRQNSWVAVYFMTAADKPFVASLEGTISSIAAEIAELDGKTVSL